MSGTCGQDRSLSEHELQIASRILSALAHPVRLGVMQCLGQGEKTVGELQECLGCSQSLMSQQLRILEEQRLIAMRREGRQKFCSVRNADFLQVFHCMKTHLGRFFRMEDDL